jgi:hypothetical protein
MDFLNSISSGLSQIANPDNYITIGDALNPSNTGASNFFNGISSGAVGTINRINNGWDNITVPAVINTLDTMNPDTNGVSQAFDPNANGFVETMNPDTNDVSQAFDPNANGFVETMNPDTNGVSQAFDPAQNGTTEAFATGTNTIVQGWEDTTAAIDKGWQENVVDILSPIGQDIINGKYSPIMFLNQQLKGTNNNANVDNTDYSVYLIMGAVAVGGVLLL